jgi:hypothetical protein
MLSFHRRLGENLLIESMLLSTVFHCSFFRPIVGFFRVLFLLCHPPPPEDSQSLSTVYTYIHRSSGSHLLRCKRSRRHEKFEPVVGTKRPVRCHWATMPYPRFDCEKTVQMPMLLTTASAERESHALSRCGKKMRRNLTRSFYTDILMSLVLQGQREIKENAWSYSDMWFIFLPAEGKKCVQYYAQLDIYVRNEWQANPINEISPHLG